MPAKERVVPRALAALLASVFTLACAAPRPVAAQRARLISCLFTGDGWGELDPCG